MMTWLGSTAGRAFGFSIVACVCIHADSDIDRASAARTRFDTTPLRAMGEATLHPAVGLTNSTDRQAEVELIRYGALITGADGSRSHGQIAGTALCTIWLNTG